MRMQGLHLSRPKLGCTLCSGEEGLRFAPKGVGLLCRALHFVRPTSLLVF